MTIKVDRKNKDSAPPKDGNSDKFITAFTDASFRSDLKSFGVAVWIKSKEGVHKTTFAGQCENNIIAEQIGLDYIVDYLANLDLSGRIVVIQCDCLSALNKLDVAKLYIKKAQYVKLKHVKGHSGRDTNRSKVNDWCDKEAKKIRRGFEKNNQ